MQLQAPPLPTHPSRPRPPSPTHPPHPLTRALAPPPRAGLFCVDFSNLAAPVVIPAAPYPDGRPSHHFHDIKWAAHHPVLYATGELPAIEVFGLQ